MRRRFFIKTAVILAASTQAFASGAIGLFETAKSNFKYIYLNSRLKDQFYNFLKNVFNLFPDEAFHQLIHDTSVKKQSDKEIYKEAQSKIGELSSWDSIFKYQLPALFKQKDEMAKQALTLLGEDTTYNGYLEIGSSGRYLDYLEEKVNIEGERYYADGKEPGYAVAEMVDRGQVSIGAKYISMADYRTKYSDIIPNNSLDLVTVYIGFHHCPLDLRIPFISSIRDTMRTGGKLVLRDHDCHSEDQMTIVALAHDVFNMGTYESWEYNEAEIRNFYTLEFIIEFVEKIGFKFNEKTLYQEGDPTKNALMMFTKV
jgi:SAM-dependent methyltransferase